MDNQKITTNMSESLDNDTVTETLVTAPETKPEKKGLNRKQIFGICFIVLIALLFFLSADGNSKETSQAENKFKMEQELQAIAKKTKIQALSSESLKFETEITTAETKIIEIKQKIESIKKTIECVEKSTKPDDCQPKTAENK